MDNYIDAHIHLDKYSDIDLEKCFINCRLSFHWLQFQAI